MKKKNNKKFTDLLFGGELNKVKRVVAQKQYSNNSSDSSFNDVLIGRKQGLSKPLVGKLKDKDKDGYPDIMDCNPDNPKEHGVFTWIKSKFVKPKPTTTFVSPAPIPTSTYTGKIGTPNGSIPTSTYTFAPSQTGSPVFKPTEKAPPGAVVVQPTYVPPTRKVSTPTPTVQPTPAEKQALIRREELKVEALRRGRGFTRTEAVRFMGGGVGVSALRSATAKGFYLKQQQEVASRRTLFPDKPKAKPLTRAEQLELQKEAYLEKYPVLGLIAYPEEFVENVKEFVEEKVPKSKEFFESQKALMYDPETGEPTMTSFYNPILALAVPAKTFTGFPKQEFISTIERKGAISKIRVKGVETRTNLFGEKITGENPLHSIGEQIVVTKGEVTPGISRGVTFGLKEQPLRPDIRTGFKKPLPPKPVDIEPFSAESAAQRLGKAKVVKSLEKVPGKKVKSRFFEEELAVTRDPSKLVGEIPLGKDTSLVASRTFGEPKYTGFPKVGREFKFISTRGELTTRLPKVKVKPTKPTRELDLIGFRGRYVSEIKPKPPKARIDIAKEESLVALVSKRVKPEVGEPYISVIGGKPLTKFKTIITKKGIEKALIVDEPTISGRVYEILPKTEEGVKFISPTGLKQKTPFALTFAEQKAVSELAVARPPPPKPLKVKPVVRGYGISGLVSGVSARGDIRTSDSFARDFISGFSKGFISRATPTKAKPLTKAEEELLKEEERKRYNVFFQKEEFKGRQASSDFVLGQQIGRTNLRQGFSPVFDAQPNVMQKPLSIPMQQFIQGQTPDVRRRFAQLDLISQRDLQKERQQQKFREQQIIRDRTKFGIGIIPAETQVQPPRQAQPPVQLITPRQPQRQIPRPRGGSVLFPGDQVPPIRTTTPPPIIRRREQPRYVKAEGWDSYALIDSTKPGKKKWMRLNEEMLTKESAESMGAEYTDKNISATYRIAPRETITKRVGKDGMIVRIPKEQVRVLDTGNKYFQRNKEKFRDFKVARGKKLPMQLTKIEKSKHRLDTRKEKMQIASAPKPKKKKIKASLFKRKK